MAEGAIRRELRATIALSLPVVFTQLSLMTMGMVDLLMVGRLGEVSIGALGMGNAVYLTTVFSFTGILMALDALIGQLFGAEKRAECGQNLWQGYWISTVLSLPLTLLFIDSTWMASVLGQTDAVAGEMGDYLYGRTWATWPFMLWAAQRGFLSGIGNTRVILYIALAGNVANAIADWILIYGNWGAPEMGVEGAGFATSICSVAMVVLSARVIHGGRYKGAYGVGFIWPRWVQIWRIVRLGVPFGLHLGVEMGAFGAAAVFAGLLGERPLAAHQIAMTLSAFTFMVPLGISVGASVRVAQCIGAKDPDGAALAGRVALALGICFAVFSAIVFLLIPEVLAGAFSDEVPLILAASTLLYIAAAFQISDALQVIGAGCLRGTGDTDLPFLANLVGHWLIGLPLGAYLAFQLGMGAAGLWIGLTIGLTLVGIVLVGRFIRGRWRERGRLI